MIEIDQRRFHEPITDVNFGQGQGRLDTFRHRIIVNGLLRLAAYRLKQGVALGERIDWRSALLPEGTTQMSGVGTRCPSSLDELPQHDDDH